MVKLEPTGNFLMPTDVKTGDTVTLTDEGRNLTAQETPFGRAVFQIGVKAGDEDKVWTMNKTTQRRLIEAWGDETSGWVDKKVKIEVLKQNVRGEIRSVIYGFPVVGKGK